MTAPKNTEEDNEPVGFALFFHNFSTFLGRAGIYLDAAPMDQWTVCRLTGDTLRRMAEG